MYVVTCSNVDKLPPITFGIAGNKVTIEAKNYVVDLDFGNDQCPLALDILNRDYAEHENYMFGTPFARQFCLQYDWDAELMRLYTPKA
jgi:hypothetical protein